MPRVYYMYISQTGEPIMNITVDQIDAVLFARDEDEAFDRLADLMPDDTTSTELHMAFLALLERNAHAL